MAITSQKKVLPSARIKMADQNQKPTKVVQQKTQKMEIQMHLDALAGSQRQNLKQCHIKMDLTLILPLHGKLLGAPHSSPGVDP